MKKALIVILAMAMLLFAACSAPAGTTAEASPEGTTAAVAASTAPETEEAATPVPTMPEGVEKTSILLLGSMYGDFSGDSHDFALTHILVTLDPENRVIRFTTFPYNLLVESEGEQGQLQFVCNTVGEDGTVALLEENFGIEIDCWVHMNMDAVIGIVDLLSGIMIESEGDEPLSGEETALYFEDTVPEDQESWVEEEEYNFREHHEAIIQAVIAAVKALGLESDDLVSVALDMQDNYATNIAEEEWQAIATTALYCLENEPQFLHVPETIETSGQDEWAILFTETDVAAVQEFVGD